MGNSNGHESDCSPPKAEGRSRVLSLDPRSPTTDISRTPIVVNKTPEGALQDPLDPRSPTNGIDRTPLAVWQSTKPGAPLLQNTEPEVSDQLDGEDDLDDDVARETQPLCDCEDITDLPRAGDPLCVTGIEDISLDDFPNYESTRLVQDEQVMLEVTDRIRLKKKKPKAAKPKELFPAKTSANTKDNTRSPLSTRTIDMNSPAKLVQRKQIKDLDKKMTCAQENSLSRFIVRDKENM